MCDRTQRTAYAETLVALGKENKNIVVLDADLGKSTMGCLFKEAYPDRYFEMGIAEQNMMSTAAGLSLTGKIPFVNSFAVFVTGRAYDQLRQTISIAGLNVKVCGSSAGLSDFGDGSTHQSVEDIAIMRAIPHLTVFAPVDDLETEQIVKYMVENEGPMYLRVNRNPLPRLTAEDTPFIFGKPAVMHEGGGVVVFAHGVMVEKALNAAKAMGQSTDIKVVNVSTLKPLDEREIIAAAGSARGIVVAEEHSVIGGLCSIVSQAMRGHGIPMEFVAIQDEFGTSAYNYDELLERYNLTADAIKAAVDKVSG
ncbi:MAG: transketolase C-terminal domain-containing protein [Bacillota bacterium]